MPRPTPTFMARPGLILCTDHIDSIHGPGTSDIDSRYSVVVATHRRDHYLDFPTQQEALEFVSNLQAAINSLWEA